MINDNDLGFFTVFAVVSDLIHRSARPFTVQDHDSACRQTVVLHTALELSRASNLSCLGAELAGRCDYGASCGVPFSCCGSQIRATIKKAAAAAAAEANVLHGRKANIQGRQPSGGPEKEEAQVQAQAAGGWRA